MYGASSIVADESYVRWTYLQHPLASATEPGLWVYRKDGRVEGEQGMLPVAVKIGSATYRGGWVIDLAVSQAFQLKGVGAMLNEIAFKEAELSLGFEVSKAARRSFLRAGWQDLGTVPLWVRPLEASAVVRGREEDIPLRVAARATSVLLRAHEWLASLAVLLLRTELVQVQRFDERADRIWESVSPAYPVIARRDRTYLNWRFADFPRPRYRLFYLVVARDAVGWVVLRLGERNGEPAGFIIDMLCLPRWLPVLLARCVSFFRAERASAVVCLHRSPSADRIFPALGFLQRDSGWPFMWRNRTLPSAAVQLASDPLQWYLTAGDSNVDKPREGMVFATPASGTPVQGAN
jgi:GNAT superfamily N-acetyltransferase